MLMILPSLSKWKCMIMINILYILFEQKYLDTTEIHFKITSWFWINYKCLINWILQWYSKDVVTVSNFWIPCKRKLSIIQCHVNQVFQWIRAHRKEEASEEYLYVWCSCQNVTRALIAYSCAFTYLGIRLGLS